MRIRCNAVTDAVDHARVPAHDLLERSLGSAGYKLSQKLVGALLWEVPVFPQGLTLAPKDDNRRSVVTPQSPSTVPEPPALQIPTPPSDSPPYIDPLPKPAQIRPIRHKCQF